MTAVAVDRPAAPSLLALTAVELRKMTDTRAGRWLLASVVLIGAALVGVVLFQSAYVAEVVRGGLQALPKGQTEAAQSLALGYWRTQMLVILPQALKMVIPGLVNTIIALFKDTSLVIIIGLMDFFSSVQQATVAPEWLGMSTEGYVFAAAVYWIFCFSMSRYSQHLEKRFHTGHSAH